MHHITSSDGISDRQSIRRGPPPATAMSRAGTSQCCTEVPMHRRNFCLGAAAASAILPGRAFAQNWPARPIRMIVPFPAGGGTDAISRQLADRITNATGWAIVIENRAGAGGNIGLEAGAQGQPGG